MKKNRMMRLASILLVATLMSTCTISGTFAKYVTTASGTDTARVAKWGVEVTAQGPSMFTNQYAKEDSTYSGTLSVKSTDDAKVVAPGTNSTQFTPATLGVTGHPEVATRITLDLKDDFKDIVLPAGTYTDYTKHVYNPTTDKWEYPETFTLANDYYPVVFTLKNGATTVARGTLAAIDYSLKTYAVDFAPDTDVTSNFTLEWEWAFEGAQVLNTKSFDAETVDKADTYLGNVAVGGAFADANAITELSYEISITATQID